MVNFRRTFWRGFLLVALITLLGLMAMWWRAGSLQAPLRDTFWSPHASSGSPSSSAFPIHPSTRASKYVILVRPIGGLGDRLRALVLGYYLASLADRRLLIDENFLGGKQYAIPGDYNWLTGSATQVKQEASEASSLWSYSDLDLHRNSFHDVDFDSKKTLQAWELYTNLIFLNELFEHRQLLDHPIFLHFAKYYHQGTLWHHALRSLLKPSPEILRLMEGVERDHFPAGGPAKFKIGIQIRAGDAEIVSLNKGKRDWYPREVPFAAVDCFVARAVQHWQDLGTVEQMSRYPGGPVVLVSADGTRFAAKTVEMLKERGIPAFTTESYGGEIQHLDRAAKTEDQTRTFLDWFLLAAMDRLVIAQSGFSETAAKFSCAPTAVFFNIPGTEGYNNFTQCSLRFHETADEGLCVPEFDRESSFTLFEKLHPPKKKKGG